jgi:3'-phosphoadenosine 5'-phosphosulfate synthase
MTDNGVIKSNSEPIIFESLIRQPDEAEAIEAETLEFIDLDIHQVQYLQTISEGWAYPLTGFMNEMQLVESMHMKTVTDALGKRHLLSVPITQHVTSEQKAALEKQSKIALRCTALGDNSVYAVMHKPTFF